MDDSRLHAMNTSGRPLSAAQQDASDPIRAGPRPATLGALVFYADWSEAYQDYVPHALLALGRHTELADGVTPVDADEEPDLCAYYGVCGIPCVIFRGTPLGSTWRVRGSPVPFEIPNTRIVGTCPIPDLLKRVDDAVVTFKRLVPPIEPPHQVPPGAGPADKRGGKSTA